MPGCSHSHSPFHNQRRSYWLLDTNLPENYVLVHYLYAKSTKRAKRHAKESSQED